MNTTSPETLLHASSVAIGDYAVLITGPSGAGKSDLALRLIDRGATLIADDCTLVRQQDGVLSARAPDTIAGSMEVRGIGILRFPHRQNVPVAMVASLVATVERLPDPAVMSDVAGISVPTIAIIASEPSASIKVELALRECLSEENA